MSRALTYGKAQRAWAKKQRKDFKRISTYLRLMQDGADFIVTGKKGQELARIMPNDSVRLDLAAVRAYLGDNSSVYHCWAYFRFVHGSRVNKYCKHRWYSWQNGQKQAIGDVVVLDSNRKIVDGIVKPEAVPRLRVDRKAIRPIQESVRNWEKLARAYFATGDAKTIADAFRETASPGTYNYIFETQQPNVPDILRIATVRMGYSWGLDRWYKLGEFERMKLEIAGAFRAALRKYREVKYADVGAYSWKTLDKAA